ncbi:MAG: alpha/beta hydrolase [Cellvibrionaceae bacterium]|nr:alpha/beta hydrolase [Cellvibrionaceae bacterium]
MQKFIFIFLLVLFTPFVLAGGQSSTITTESIKMKSIELETRVGKLAANLYLPEDKENPPLVIVTGAWTTVKEQMPAVYAKALAEKGFAALSFDFRGWGQSADDIKFLEDPTRKIEDITAVIEAAGSIKGVDSSRLAGLGICASSGYILDAAINSDDLKSVAVVAPWLHDKALVESIYGGAEGVDNLLSVAEESKGLNQFIEAASLSNEEALMFQAPYYTEVNRGLIPEYDNQFNLASWEGWLNYNALQSASQQTKPVLMVASEAMALPAGAEQYIEKSGPNVKAVWLDNISQFDFYDQEQAVNKAVDAVSEHFIKTL